MSARDCPVYGPYRWRELPTEWEVVSGVTSVYGGGVTGRTVTYVSTRPPSGRTPSPVWEALGEIQVMHEGEAVARFGFYPGSMCEPPDYPGWKEASWAARGYAWRICDEEGDDP